MAYKQRAYGSFKADLEQFANETEEALLDVTRASLQDLVMNMQTPVAKGGRMRVDTGFLRNSGLANIGSMPSGESVRPKESSKGQYNWNPDSLNAVLAKLKVGDVFYWGWTAEYARPRELYDGFMEAATMQWARIVAFNADTLRRKRKK